MKATGVIRCVDELGRLVIPKEIRRNMDVNPGDPMEIFVEGSDTIVLKKHLCACVFCGNGDDLSEYKGKTLCAACISEIKEI